LSNFRRTTLVVVHVYPDNGGIAAIVENLITLLMDRAEVHLAIVDARPGAAERIGVEPDRLHVLGPRRLANSLLMPGSLAFAARTTRWLRGVLATVSPELIIVQDALDLPIPAALAARGTGTKLVIMDHGTLSNVLDRRWQRMMRARLGFLRGTVFWLGFQLDAPWRALRWRLGLRTTDGAWYVGHELADRFKWAGAKAHRYAQMVPVDFRPPGPGEREAARARLGLDRNAVVVNLVTRLDPEKDLESILDATQNALRLQPRLHVMVGGDGTLFDWFKLELEHRKLTSRVSLMGRISRSEIQQLHHASDFHLYAGVIGCGMSVALLEAMSCGVIPIVSDVPSEHRELVANSGWVFNAGDRSALRDALAEAVTAPEERLAELRAAVGDRLESYDSPSLAQLVDELLGEAA
jgi:glycosyltransferase involved in cell wall biosynthesis